VARIRLESHELAVFVPNPGPAGPFPTASFEVDLLTPTQFGAFVPWLMVNRGPLSALIHPNTMGSKVTDHVEHAMWLGEKWPLDVGLFDRIRNARESQGIDYVG
jgi:aromatic ring-cleaving dioxygenase